MAPHIVLSGETMAGESLVVFWKEWGLLALVLMSFALQMILLITAEIRRRKDSGVLQVVVWSAYLLADTTAIYALGHMSVTSCTTQEHHLVAFWAPFLLLHLGGQDNITAYSIEDNRLWLRHLQSFVIQVLAAAYVLYQSSILARRTLLRPAAILMFVVGVVKYGERVCALKLACSGSKLSGKNYQSFSNVDMGPRHHGYNPNRGEERYSQTFRAHVLLDIPKNLLKGPLAIVSVYKNMRSNCKEMYGVAEVQLSLMHDVFYSKAELIHTWYGYCIRVVSLPATVTALMLFRRFSEKDGYRRADVVATYVLLAGAVVLEITSVLRAMFSTWTYHKYKLMTASRHSVARALARLVFLPLWCRRHALARYAICRGGERRTIRYWSGSMGQHNIIYMCSQCKDSRGSKIARWMGREDWWNMLVYTSSVPVWADISQLLEKPMWRSRRINNESSDHIRNSRGRAALKMRPGIHEELGWSLDTEPDESLLLWHIATHVYVSWYEETHAGRLNHLAQVTQELSNYIIFLLAARPYMLPDNASRQRYVEICNAVLNQLKCSYRSEADLLKLIRDHGDALLRAKIEDVFERNTIFDRACLLGAMLISKELETPDANMLELISQVWVELLCYVALRCRPDSHARQLSNGGEFTTVVAILLEYAKSESILFEFDQ
ncbi:hypothetical protein QYE76_033646 [Lolium multiflorum]|uniref:DUF4220 domain-containing protein n=1 Tax=Lolium multiflorum TaxID=4521 RepID=A0AAD8QZH3_LOLMU|nr:hypothetical protein QYE76_033646 [Lolium multiflorum]